MTTKDHVPSGDPVANELRRLAGIINAGTLKEAMYAGADRIDELVTLTKLLNRVGSMSGGDHTEELVELRQRLAQLEQRIPQVVDLSMEIRSVLKSMGYGPR